MKKWLCALLTFCLLLGCALAEQTPEPLKPLDEGDFTFTYEDAIYFLGSEAAPLIAAIELKTSAKMETAEVDSCLFDGKDREFSNKDLVLGTYPIGENKADVLETIIVLSETYQTARGAQVGMSLDEIAELYGEDFVLDYDQMIFTMGENMPMLVFTIDQNTDEVLSWSLMKNTTK